MLRMERVGTVREGELITEPGAVPVSLDGDLLALFEGRMVQITITEVDRAKPEKPGGPDPGPRR